MEKLIVKITEEIYLKDYLLSINFTSGQIDSLLRKKDITKVKKAILDSGVKQVIFSAMALGWKELALDLKKENPDIKIKVFWHGSNSQVSEPYGWARNIEIIELHKEGTIDVFATCRL